MQGGDGDVLDESEFEVVDRLETPGITSEVLGEGSGVFAGQDGEREDGAQASGVAGGDGLVIRGLGSAGLRAVAA